MGADDGGGRFDQRAWAEDLLNQGKRAVRVTYPRTANNEKELTVVRGEFLEVIDDSRNWWKCRNSRGQFAHVPHTIVGGYEMGGGPQGPPPKSAVVHAVVHVVVVPV